MPILSWNRKRQFFLWQVGWPNAYQGEVQNHRWACHSMEKVKTEGEEDSGHSEGPHLLVKNAELPGWEWWGHLVLLIDLLLVPWCLGLIRKGKHRRCHFDESLSCHSVFGTDNCGLALSPSLLWDTRRIMQYYFFPLKIHTRNKCQLWAHCSFYKLNLNNFEDFSVLGNGFT